MRQGEGQRYSQDHHRSAETPAPRVANLDLLRAIAISLVVPVSMVGEEVLAVGPSAAQILESGWIGVDLFFILSGWLVGGLYWRELSRFGDVQLRRFWARRWLRTIPPYVVAFLVVFVARSAVAGQDTAFDWRYFVFIQNYTGAPYWAVSWSLCVEEHFYLVLPLLLGVALRIPGGVPLALGSAALVSLLSRVLTIPDGSSPWGLGYTATHMRLEGLALGVAAACVYYRHRHLWPGLRRVGRLVALPGLAFIATIPWLPLDVLNRYAYAGVALAFLAVLLVVVGRRPLPFAESRLVKGIALTSYSIYMTHPVVLDGYRVLVMATLPGVPAYVHALVALLGVGLVGAVFYIAVERPSLWLRRRIAPRRTHEPSPALVDVV